ncbi:MAG: glycosyltransferase family 1 protein [Candidatus Daviesbacteria bacterium]|nr:glycosyltransferase family 1 protein [Candidatus Daviesbacteria bacterium]
MKIVIDGRMYAESGVGRYIRNLITQLQIIDKKNEYFILLLQKDYPFLKESENFRKVVAEFRWYGVGEQIKLPKVFNSLKADLVHFPHFNVPLLYRGKFVVTIHDLIHQHFQMRRATTLDPLTYKIKQLAYIKVFKNAVTKSLKILVPSNYVKELLIDEWSLGADKIVVTPEAVDDNIFSIEKIMNKEKIERVMRKFKINTPYIFYVGNAHPHKNIEGLIRAFLELRKKYPDLYLVLSGYDHYFWQRIREEFQYPGIIYTGHISDEELVALYKEAECFVMPSFEEGFGIPLLEAMACGCPVVSSNAASLLEVGLDAAIYFDPRNSQEMIEKILQVLEDANLKEKLVKKGKERIKVFSWEKLAKQTLEVYSSCV